jgi:hypothetical protein
MSIVALACRLGPYGAIEFSMFQDTLKGLDAGKQKVLIRAWLAAESMPHDASRERDDILRVIFALRDEWQHNLESC